MKYALSQRSPAELLRGREMPTKLNVPGLLKGKFNDLGEGTAMVP